MSHVSWRGARIGVWGALALIVGLGAAVDAAAAGLEIHMRSREHEDGAMVEKSGRVLLAGHSVEIFSQEGEGEPVLDMIFHGDRQQLIAVEHETRTYIIFDEAAMDRMAGMMAMAQGNAEQFKKQMEVMQKQMEKALAEMPEDQREQAEQMMKQYMNQMQPPQQEANAGEPAKFELEKTSRKEKVAGKPAVCWEVLRNGEKVSEIWVTDWKNVDARSEDMAPIYELGAFIGKMITKMPMAGDEMEGMWVLDRLRDIDGFPMRIVGFEDGEASEETIFDAVRRAKLDPEDFVPPAGYELKDPFDG